MYNLLSLFIGQSALVSYHGRSLLLLPEVCILLASISMLMKLKRSTLSTVTQNIQSQTFLAIGFLAVGFFMAAWLSNSHTLALGGLKAWFFLPLLGFFLLAYNQKGFDWVLAYLGGALVLQVLYGITQTGFHRLSGTLSSPNYLAMLLLPTAIMLLGRANSEKIPARRNGLYAVIGILMFGVLLTRSLGALLALGMVFLWLTRERLKYPFRKGIILFSLLLVLSLFVLGISSRLAGGSENSLSSRLEIWQTALVLGQEHPLTGLGMGNFQVDYAAKVVSVLGHTPIEWSVPLPHNIFLAFWLVLGLPGLIGLVLLIQQVGARKRNVLVSLPFFALIVHGLVDTPYFFTPVVYVFWLSIAWVFVWQKSQASLVGESKS